MNFLDLFILYHTRVQHFSFFSGVSGRQDAAGTLRKLSSTFGLYYIEFASVCVFTFFCFHNTCCIYSSASVNAATIWWVGGGEADGDFDTCLDPKLPISPTSSLGPCQSLLTFLRAGRLWRFFCFVLFFFLIHLNLF